MWIESISFMNNRCYERWIRLNEMLPLYKNQLTVYSVRFGKRQPPRAWNRSRSSVTDAELPALSEPKL